MVDFKDVLSTHPRMSGSARTATQLNECIQACYACEQVCTACADACLGEADPRPIVACIRTNLDCADMCTTTGRMLSRRTEPSEQLIDQQVRLLAEMCASCAQECAKHAERMEHCQRCADACRECQLSCEAYAD